MLRCLPPGRLSSPDALRVSHCWGHDSGQSSPGVRVGSRWWQKAKPNFAHLSSAGTVFSLVLGSYIRREEGAPSA